MELSSNELCLLVKALIDYRHANPLDQAEIRALLDRVYKQWVVTQAEDKIIEQYEDGGT